MRTSSTSDFTIVPNAPPMMIPMAMSSTLPRMMNALKSLSMCPSLWVGLRERPRNTGQEILRRLQVLEGPEIPAGQVHDRAEHRPHEAGERDHGTAPDPGRVVLRQLAHGGKHVGVEVRPGNMGEGAQGPVP